MDEFIHRRFCIDNNSGGKLCYTGERKEFT